MSCAWNAIIRKLIVCELCLLPLSVPRSPANLQLLFSKCWNSSWFLVKVNSVICLIGQCCICRHTQINHIWLLCELYDYYFSILYISSSSATNAHSNEHEIANNQHKYQINTHKKQAKQNYKQNKSCALFCVLVYLANCYLWICFDTQNCRHFKTICLITL